MEKKVVFHVGDIIQIIEPKWVKRVGYPLVWMDLQDEVRRSEKTAEACKALGLSYRDPDHIPHYFIQALAKLEVERRKFGGNERTIHYITGDEVGRFYPSRVSQLVRVDSKRVVKTGKRWFFYDPEEGSEGGLEDMKTHILLKTHYGEIEACNVKLRRDGKEGDFV